jgi:Phosphatidylserine decarboxylase
MEYVSGVDDMLSDPVKIPKDSKELMFLYRTIPGRIALKLLSSRAVSYVAGAYMDSSLSCSMIEPFAKNNDIDMSQYEEEKYDCFNSFFTRHIRSDLRPIDMEPSHFIAPSDGLLSAYHIHEGLIVPIKQSNYSVYDLVRDKRVADMYKDGICLVFRLCVDNYHRYCYPVSGYKSKNKHIDGSLHTVRPIALRTLPIFTENSREYTLIKTDNFSTVLMMEVGAMLVGKIKNLHDEKQVSRGEEKGYFEYGGSTIVLLIKKDKVIFDDRLFEATDNGYETPVLMGECIGHSFAQG